RWNPTMPWRPFQQPWSPLEGIASLRNEMDQLYESFVGSTQPSGIRESAWTPRVDLLEHEHAFVLVADLPGMKADDVNLAVPDSGAGVELVVSRWRAHGREVCALCLGERAKWSGEFYLSRPGVFWDTRGRDFVCVGDESR